MTVTSVKPSVFRTPSSFVRSRIDCAIVLPAMSRITKKTTAAIADRMAPVSPIWCAKDCASAFSVVVFVSSGEFANWRSMACATASAWSGWSTSSTYQPTVPGSPMRSMR
jgi:hypothetical protein